MMEHLTTWPQVIAAMRRQEWDVEVYPQWVDVVTAHGRQGGFERTARGLQAACQFYHQQSSPVQLAQTLALPAYVMRRPRSRFLAALVLLACFAVVLAAIAHGLLVPAHGLACLLVMVAILPIFIVYARRLS